MPSYLNRIEFDFLQCTSLCSKWRDQRYLNRGRASKAASSMVGAGEKYSLWRFGFSRSSRNKFPTLFENKYFKHFILLCGISLFCIKVPTWTHWGFFSKYFCPNLVLLIFFTITSEGQRLRTSLFLETLYVATRIGIRRRRFFSSETVNQPNLRLYQNDKLFGWITSNWHYIYVNLKLMH